MGRTLVSITQQLAQAEERLGRYRRALTRADQKIFDDLFALARRRLAASSMAADPLPMQIILLGMLIGTASAVAGLAARVEALEHERPLPPRLDP
ncbi:MAG: hypothetical protein JW748_01090 [Anaerolineales bacterium]|nr:hypothetical protein [Anaerolineales bacterium]